MTRRTITIHIDDDDMTEQAALSLVSIVVARGRISNHGRAYCLHTNFRSGHDIEAVKRKTIDTFYVSKKETK